MKLLVIPNPDKSGTKACMSCLADLCAKLPFTLLLEEGYREIYPDFPAVYGCFSDLLQQCDFVLTIGGDGTILHTAQRIMHAARPIVGINTGRMGFLTTLEAEELSQLEKLLTGSYTIENRMLLQATLLEGDTLQTFTALNDVIIGRGANTRIIDVDLYCDDTLVGSYRADGLVFSTPSGSTAYALSAGGPVVDPMLQAIEVTPVCAHSMFNRSMVFSAQRLLTVSAPSSRGERQAYLTIDGNSPVALSQCARVQIEPAPHALLLVNLSGRAFYEVLSRKLMSNDR